jgi:ADP-ribose pyrophosphatase YjhB (NUDIX family)
MSQRRHFRRSSCHRWPNSPRKSAGSRGSRCALRSSAPPEPRSAAKTNGRVSSIKKIAARALMITADRARRAWWFVRRPQLHGVRGIAITPEHNLVLIRHSYTKGWHLPGGGIRRGESAEEATVRELREEIGLVGWTQVRAIGQFDHMLGYARDHVSVLAVYDAQFLGNRSLEVEEVRLFSLGELPDDLSPEFKRWAESAMDRPAEERNSA